MKRTPKNRLDKTISEIIKKALGKIKITDLRIAARASLLDFYRRQFNEWQKLSNDVIITAAFFYALQSRERTTPTMEERRALERQGIFLSEKDVESEYFKEYGVPLKRYSQEYTKELVRPTIERLAKQYALDPNDVTGRNSLRNLAEMEVRYNDHQESIQRLKNSGVRLVIASTHSDCSERCAPWQGKVFSLDGTSGITDDGRRFVPLEKATDVWYVTKAGKAYKNGLLGFNCRHYLVPYEKGLAFQEPNAKVEREQRAITAEQRRLERHVREWKTRAIENKESDYEAYRKAKEKAREWTARYVAFNKKHERAGVPSRLQVI